MYRHRLVSILTGSAFLFSLFSLIPVVSSPASAQSTSVSINEIRIDQPSTDNDEYFELVGAPGAALDGLTYLVIGDGTGGSGVIENVTDLSGQAIPASGYFVAAESTFSSLLGHSPNHTGALQALAELYESQERFGDAENALLQIARYNPSTAYHFHRLGQFYERIGKPRKARKAYAKAERIDPLPKRRMRPLRKSRK